MEISTFNNYFNCMHSPWRNAFIYTMLYSVEFVVSFWFALYMLDYPIDNDIVLMTMCYFLSSFINFYSHKLVCLKLFVAHCSVDFICFEWQASNKKKRIKSQLIWHKTQLMGIKEAAHFSANLCIISGPLKPTHMSFSNGSLSLSIVFFFILV